MSTASPHQDDASLRPLLDALGAFVFTKDESGRYRYANAALLRCLGKSEAEVLGSTTADLLGLDAAPQSVAHDMVVLVHGQTLEVEEQVRWPDGQQRTYWSIKRPLRDAAGKVNGLCGVSIDISERKELDARLQEQRQLLDVVLNTIDAYVYMKDEHRRYRYVNTRVAKNLGIRAEDAVGKLDTEVLPKEWADQFWALDKLVFERGEPVSGEESHTAADGTVLHHWSTKVPVRYEGDHVLIGFSTDITELVRLREQLRQQAITDSLTGLFNRRHFTELADKELGRARRHGLPTSLLMLDIDHFKRINDHFGHPTGDAVLQRLGSFLQEQLRSEDVAARMGGEEFALLLPSTDALAARLLAERLCEQLANTIGLLPDGSAVTMSIGLVTSESGRERLEQLYAAADEQLYLAKQGGRNRVCG